MKFGFVTLGSKVPSTRFRFDPYLPSLREAGHQCRMWTCYPSVYDHLPWLGWRLSHQLKRSVRRWQWLQSRSWQPDCIYLERGCLNDASLDLDQRFRQTTPRLVLDVDDGIFLEQPQKIDALLAISDHVVVSNEPIAEYIRPRHPQVTLIPTIVSTQRFRPRRASGTEGTARPIIGWIGTLPNMPFLSVCATALRRLAQRREFELLVVAPHAAPLSKIDLAGVRVRFQTWSAADEVQSLQQMDIGIMPLPAGQEWMRYKAATKLVQYLATGIPAVASPIGSGAAILADQRVGLAANTTEEWLAALEKLLDDATLRQQMGAAGRELVVRKYSLDANLPRLEAVLRGLPVPAW